MTKLTKKKAAPAKSVRLMSGNEAVVEGALLAGCDFFAGYPITPSTEVLEQLSYKLPARGGRYIQMEDEIAAMAAVIGASLAGAKALTATSGPGFSLKQENIGFAVMAEVPVVIANVMRGGPSTGLPTHSAQGDVMQARWGTHGDHAIIALAPSTAEETIELTIEAFNLAERYRTPVILLLDEVLGHGSERVVVPEIPPERLLRRKRPTVGPEDYLPYENTPDGVPPMADFGTGYRWHVTGLSHDETGFPTNKPEVTELLHRRLLWKIEDAKDQLPAPEVSGDDDAEIAVVAYGSTARSARRAATILRGEGVKVRLIRPRALWPFQDTAIVDAITGAERVVVVEMNAGQVFLEVQRAVAGRVPVTHLGRLNGELLSPKEIADAIRAAREPQSSSSSVEKEGVRDV